ncbi:MAG: metalloregulator ArsR/SmtB family transcription factor [Candidatus Bathyarchaeota archaeon]|nr:metalloregulator ArsR/SmtB family transcription factor [Candidatus Bathyarchaeota archaeon]
MAEKAKIDMTIYELQAEISKTLANPIRLAVLHSLREGEKTVNELSEILGARQSNLSQHLAVLRQRGIVKTRKQGASIFYSTSNPKINQACDMVREVLLDQLKQKQELAKAYP